METRLNFQEQDVNKNEFVVLHKEEYFTLIDKSLKSHYILESIWIVDNGNRPRRWVSRWRNDAE